MHKHAVNILQMQVMGQTEQCESDCITTSQLITAIFQFLINKLGFCYLNSSHCCGFVLALTQQNFKLVEEIKPDIQASLSSLNALFSYIKMRFLTCGT